jgi:hypothetical protein
MSDHKTLYMNCICKGPIKFYLLNPTVEDNDERVHLEVWHSNKFVYKARLGGRNFVANADNMNVAATVSRRIAEAMEFEKCDAGCVAIFANGASVLRTLVAETP